MSGLLPCCSLLYIIPRINSPLPQPVLTFTYVSYKNTRQILHTVSSTPLSLTVLPFVFPSIYTSVCSVMCVLSWHFTVLSLLANISHSALPSNFPIDCLLSVCLCLPSLPFMRYYARLTSSFFFAPPWPQYSLSSSTVCKCAGCSVYTVSLAVIVGQPTYLSLCLYW